MSEELRSTAMEGGGAYNKYAKLPAGGAALAVPLLEKAILDIPLDLGDRPIVIGDYGSSQGRNSLAPMTLAVQALRTRIGKDRPILVFHIDQPANDFNSLFNVLATDPDRYALGEPNVFPCAIGRSFYERVLPPASVHIGWCSYAAVWLSRIPSAIPGHFISIAGAGAVRDEFERQAAIDWERFLSLRANELIPGGRLIVALPAVADDGLTGFETLMNHANEVLGEMVDEGAITADERARMVLGSHPRRSQDLLAPFVETGKFQGLTVETLEILRVTDAAWAVYEGDGDANAFATKHAQFFRSVFMPSLATAIGRVRAGDVEALISFANRLEDGLKRHLAFEPTAMHTYVQTIALVKQSSG
jgi:hypothetical protein